MGGADGSRGLERPPPPWNRSAGLVKIEVGELVFLAISVSDRLVAKRRRERTAVVLVKAFAGARPVMKPPPPPANAERSALPSAATTRRSARGRS